MHAARHHLETFNYFAFYELQNIIQGEMPLEIISPEKTITITFHNVHFGLPPIWPNEARLRNLTYQAPIFVDIEEVVESNGVKTKRYWPKELFSTIPIPLKSEICNTYNATEEELQAHGESNLDPGGYFIIRGKERVLVSQLRMAYNSPVIIKNGQKFVLEIRLCNNANMHTTQLKIEYNNEELFIHSCFFKEPILLAHLFVVLNTEPIFASKTHIHAQILRRLKWLMKKQPRAEIIDCLAHQLKTFTGDTSAVERIICFELFPHISFFAPNQVKSRHLCILVDELLCSVYTDSIPERFDRDNLSNKRLEPAGILCGELFRQMFKKFCLMLTQEFSKRIINPNIKLFLVKNSIISKKFLACFMNPSWGAQQNGYVRIGVSQILSNTNYPALLSHLQRISIPVTKDTKNTQLRQLHPSHFNYICGCESPEGINIGLVLNLTAFCRISPKTPQVALCHFFQQFARDTSGPFVFFNGVEIGQTNTSTFIEDMITLRTKGILPWFVSFFKTTQLILIWADEGRFFFEQTTNFWIDPLEKYMFKFGDLTQQMFGTCAGIIPLINHSPAPRGCYGSNMIKQAIGHVSSNMLLRTETNLYNLDYPQKMLVSTKIARQSNLDEMPFGNNVIVAILSETGFNQEDACILHKAAIERGLFVSSVLMTFSEEETNSIKISLPPPDIQKHDLNYSTINANGIPQVGQILYPNDVIIGKWVHESGKKSKDLSVFVKKTPCIVTFVYNLISETNQRLIKVVVREVNFPQVGDKFSSVIYQKGVDGMVCSTENMPFTKDGMIPDIIINPHAIPSRMTISQLIDMVLGKESALTGKIYDGTPFGDPVTNIGAELARHGFDPMGEEIMYSGITGRRFKTPIFIGITYYMRLKHLVSDKIHARDSGCVTALTRSAPEGRRRDGGLKFGEMERDALLAHGTSQMLLERLFKFADSFNVLVCEHCHEIVFGNNCKSCNIVPKKVSLPYIFKLIKQELAAMNLKLELKI